MNLTVAINVGFWPPARRALRTRAICLLQNQEKRRRKIYTAERYMLLETYRVQMRLRKWQEYS